MKSKLFTNIQAIENTWEAKHIQKSSTSQYVQYELNSLRYEASKMGVEFLDTLYFVIVL